MSTTSALPGDIVEVKGTFAMAANYPSCAVAAIRWDPWRGEARSTRSSAYRGLREIRSREHADEVPARFRGADRESRVTVKSGDTGRLFGSVTDQRRPTPSSPPAGRWWRSAPSRSTGHIKSPVTTRCGSPAPGRGRHGDALARRVGLTNGRPRSSCRRRWPRTIRITVCRAT